jgi:translocator protein
VFVTVQIQRWAPALVAAMAAIFVATMGGTMTDLGPWYQSLRKPAWQPPDWLFGPAWTLIFALTALAGLKAWQGAGDKAGREWVIGLFALNGFLNIMWSVFFFRFKRPDWALLEVLLLWLSILLLIVFFWRLARPASLLLMPYLAWVSFAATINLGVVLLNE